MLKEKVFRRLYKELPYEMQIEDVSFKTLTDGSLRIEKNLMVRSDQVSTMLTNKMLAALCFSPVQRSMPLQLLHLFSKHDANLHVCALSTMIHLFYGRMRLRFFKTFL